MSSDNENGQKEVNDVLVILAQEDDKCYEIGVELCKYIKFIKYVKSRYITFR